MEYSTFSDFYDVVIKKYLDEILYKFGSKVNSSLKIKKESCIKSKIYKFYQQKRNQVKLNFMQKNVVALDGHKVAACFIYAILRCKPFKISFSKRNLPEEILLANEFLAFYVALNIVDMYRRHSTDSKNFVTKIPETYSDNDDPNSFIKNTCKSLHYIYSIKHIDIFAYSTILFLLEKYTDTIKN